MKWLKRHDAIYLILAIVLAVVGALAAQKLNDHDVGWLFAVFTVTMVIVQFMYIYELRSTSFFVADYQRIRDRFLRGVLDDKVFEIQQLAEKAGKEGRIDLRLDDLFKFVTLLVSRCNKLDAVDIRIERWDHDIRAQMYFNANRDASARGAMISRIFVFNHSARDDLDAFLSNGIESEDVKQIRKLLKMQREVGINVAFVFNNETRDMYDFGIFDDEKVLDENFDAAGNSKYEGFISSVPSEVREYRDRYQRLMKLTQKHQAALERLVGD